MSELNDKINDFGYRFGDTWDEADAAATKAIIASTLTDFAAKVKAEAQYQLISYSEELVHVVPVADIDRLLADTLTRIKEQ